MMRRQRGPKTDPDSEYINHGKKSDICYPIEITFDCKYGIITCEDIIRQMKESLEEVVILLSIEDANVSAAIPIGI